MKCWIEDEWRCEFKLDGAHTQDMLQMDRQLLFKEIPFDISDKYIFIFGQKCLVFWYLLAPPRYKGKSADLELPRAAAL